MGKKKAFFHFPISRQEAADFISEHHRHHGAPQGYKTAIAAAPTGSALVVGVGIIARPVSRHLDDHWTAEITRVAVMEDPAARNCCSYLYGALRRIAFAMGYRRIITYTLPEEGGASLKGAGYTEVGLRGGGSWDRPSRPRIDKAPTAQKTLWTSEQLQAGWED